MNRTEKLLLGYSGALTLALMAFLLTAATDTRSAKFDRIEVQRIDVREADGTLRMVISNRARFPGATFASTREYPHDRKAAGMIFFNDEGTENGGLIFNGSKSADGRVGSFGHLSFDPYDRDQALALNQVEANGAVSAGLAINDTGERSMEDLVRENVRIQALEGTQRARAQATFEAGVARDGLKRRLYVGKDAKQVSVVSLADANGKPRLRMQVTPDGQARIDFLDADGKVQRTLSPDAQAPSTR